MVDVKHELLAKLREARQAVVAALDGLDEYDVRRPMTPSGTNLLGIVKHLVGNEHVYLGESFGRPAPDVLPWVEDGSIWQDADMWARADEDRDELLALYERACAHGDATVAALDLDAPALVAHWPPARRRTTLAFLLVRMVEETGHHAGHADILRELIDGRTQAELDDRGPNWWRGHVAEVQAAADRFRRPG